MNSTKQIFKNNIAVSFACLILIFFMTIENIFAHGTVTSPPSRIWICYQENPESPVSPACIAAVASHGTQPLYDWNGINQPNANGNHIAVVPDNNLASGGMPVKYGGMDQVRSDWVKTSVSAGAYTVTWTNSAPHATEYYEVYITKASWNPNQPLTWNDLTLLVRTDPSAAASSVDIPVTLPARTGHDVIYSVWQRSDSPEAFYSASDVDFGGGGSIPDPALVHIEGDVEIDLSATIKQDLLVWNQYIEAPNPKLTFRSSSDSSEYKLTYQKTLDKFIIEQVGTGVAFEIQDGMVYLPQYANGTSQNLSIDGSGKIIVKKQNNYGKYNFSTSEVFTGYTTKMLGIQLINNTTISSISGYLLDNNTSPGTTDDNTAFIILWRQSKTSDSSSAELIFQITSTNTATETFTSFSNNTLVTPGANIVDNDAYIYFVEVSYCDDCDFREVTVLEQ